MANMSIANYREVFKEIKIVSLSRPLLIPGGSGII